MRSVLKLSSTEARRYFLSNHAYCAFDLPSYYDFTPLLQCCKETLAGRSYFHLVRENDSPRNYEGVNYAIFHNKGASYDWRKLQLIHPMIYTGLVNILASKPSWEIIIDRFKELQCENIYCASMPTVVRRPAVSDPECAIKNWADNLVDKNLEFSCEYNYLLKTDITNCYDSIQTHTIAWAIHGAREAKWCQHDTALLGNQISRALQDMSYGSANGIPQGSILSDLLVELILGYIDTLVQEQLYHYNIRKVQLLRYRDDYHIYARDKRTAEQVFKILAELLATFNFRINQAKTVEVNDIVLASWKPDKYAWLKIEDTVLNSNLPLKNRLMLMKEHSVSFPNCGSLRIGLSKLYLDNIMKMRREPRDLSGVIAILIDIMYHNPGAYPICMAILIKLLNLLKDDSQIAKFLRIIAQKFGAIPHNEHFYVWMQRLTFGINPHYRYSNKLCTILYDQEVRLWNSEWLEEPIEDIMVVNQEILNDLPTFLPPEEVCLFNVRNGSGG